MQVKNMILTTIEHIKIEIQSLIIFSQAQFHVK